MQRFIRDEFFSSLLQPLDFNEFVPILDQLKANFTGSLGETFSVPQSGDLAAVINLPNKCTRDIFSTFELSLLSDLYNGMYNTSDIQMNSTFKSIFQYP